MYIHPYIAGVLTVIIVELGAMFLIGITSMVRNNKGGRK